MKIKSVHLLSLLLTLSHSAWADNVSPYAYDWTGVYLGGFIGGAASSKTNTTEPYSNMTSDYWYERFNNSYNYNTSASFIGGGTIGYNWQVAKTALLLGLEGEYGYLDMSGSSRDPNSTAFGAAILEPNQNIGTHSTNIGGSYGYGVVGGRIGYVLDRSLFYVKSGAVFTNTQTNYDDLSGDGHMQTSGRNNSVGYAIGAGFEYALPFTWANNVSIKTEYLWLGINRTQTTSGNANAPGATYDGSTYTTTDSISGIHTAKLGVNYKF
jgi:outer membrane immunogenic protein